MFNAFYRRKRRRPAKAKQERSRLTLERFGPGGGARSLRVEQVEPRLLLTAHVAPQLNSADTTAFGAMTENTTIASNTGQAVSMLFQGKTITTSPPVGTNFAYFDSTANEGIAVTGVNTLNDGWWEFSTDAGSHWQLLGGDTTPANAVVLSATTSNDKIRFIANYNFTGTVSLQIAAWDQSDGLMPGSSVDLTAPGATGGSSAYSTATVTASLTVNSTDVPPTFTLPASVSTEENYTDSYNPGGTNPGTITLGPIVSNVTLGSGGNNAVTFSVSDTANPSWLTNPTIDAAGQLSFQLVAGKHGSDTLDITAHNGSVSSAVETTTLNLTQVSPPSFTPSNEFVDVGGGPQSFSNWATNVSDGSGGGASVSYVFGGDIGYFSAGPSADSSGTLSVTPNGTRGYVNQSAQIKDTATGAISGPAYFALWVENLPTFSMSQTSLEATTGASQQTIDAEATDIASGGNDTDTLSFVVTNDDNNAFSVQPAIDSSGTLTYTPSTGQNGKATVTVYLKDLTDGGESNPQTFTITVYSPPITVADTYVMETSGTTTVGASIGLLAHVSDPNSAFDGGAALTPSIVAIASNGIVTLQSNGSFTYAANAGFYGYDQFSYTVQVGPATSAVKTVTIYTWYTAMVEKVYTEVLNRAPGTGYSGDLDYWGGQLQGGMSMSTFANDISTSTEHEDDVVTSIFWAFLGRAPSSTDLSYWGPYYAQYGGPEQIINEVASTTESFDHAGGTDADWVTLVYQKCLNRTPSQAELNGWASASQQAVMDGIVGSPAGQLAAAPEYQSDIIKADYNLFLVRNPQPSDTTYWQDEFDAALTGVEFDIDLASSSEYQSEPQAASSGNAVLWKWG